MSDNRHYGPIEDAPDDVIRSVGAQRKMHDYRTVHVEHGDVTDADSDVIRSMEAQRKMHDYRTVHVEHGDITDADSDVIRSMEAQRKMQLEQDKPHKEYFNNLITNPDITDQEEFESAVSRSMQSNEIMRTFVDNLCGKIGEKTVELKNTDKNDKDKIQSSKQEIEKLVAIYERYMYTLKDKQWDFSDLNRMKMPEYVTDNLWQQQKRLDVVFTMPIPANLGENYGKKFERDGKMIPGFELMYQDLTGKDVNWHQVMIYRENELTELKVERQQGGNSYGE